MPSAEASCTAASGSGASDVAEDDKTSGLSTSKLVKLSEASGRGGKQKLGKQSWTSVFVRFFESKS